jgi:hypothetical protein
MRRTLRAGFRLQRLNMSAGGFENQRVPPHARGRQPSNLEQMGCTRSSHTTSLDST